MFARKIYNLIKNPKLLLFYLDRKNLFRMNDEEYLKINFEKVFKRKLNLNNPETFNEKLQWLKLHDRKSNYTIMVDKYEVKSYVSKLIGDQYIIPTIGVYNKFSEIDFDKLPNQFVIKCTHDSGGIIICKNKEQLDIKSVNKTITKLLKRNFYYQGREWPYKNVSPKIIIEKYMEDKNNKSMVDYKFFCFNGKPEIMYISEGLENHDTAQMSFYNMDFELMTIKRKDYKLLEHIPKKPKNFEKMKEFASILSKNIPHLRVDFYEINEKLYFGELTFYTCSGFIPFETLEQDLMLGRMLNLGEVQK